MEIILITLCTLILLGYIFDITSAKTKIPSVILLLVLGWLVKEVTVYLWVDVPDLEPLLPLLGTVGLILIVLEGSLDLEFNKSKLTLLNRAFWMALLALVLLSGGLTAVFIGVLHYPVKDSLLSAIPIFIISSAIAIPSARNLSKPRQEFVVYESSLSDILGVIFFNFFLLNEGIGGSEVLSFLWEILLMCLISFVATAGLSFLLSKINHHIKFVPIILLVLIIYGLSKIYHLPALIFIMVFGLFLGNLDELRRFKWMSVFKPDVLDKEVGKFKDLTTEATFLVRSLFFLLFGFLIDVQELLDLESLAWAGGICGGIFLVRYIQLRLLRLHPIPLLFIAPRGLITILLFLSIPDVFRIPLVTKPLIIQVIILTALVMMLGLMVHKKPKTEGQPIEDNGSSTEGSEDEAEDSTQSQDL